MMSSDLKFSDELQYLMAEWVIFTAIRNHTLQGDVPDGLSDTELFENYSFSNICDSSFEQDQHLFFGFGIIDFNFRGTCLYSEIANVIRSKSITSVNAKLDNPIAYYFSRSAGRYGCIKNYKLQGFYAEEKCLPLITAFIKEEFCVQDGEQYFWLNEIYPLFKNMVDIQDNRFSKYLETKRLNQITPALAATLEKQAEIDHLIAAQTLRDNTDFNLNDAIDHIQYKYNPEFTQPFEEKIVFRWFANP